MKPSRPQTPFLTSGFVVAILVHNQLLGLSRIPDLGTTSNPSESDAVAVASPVATTTTTAPGVGPSGDNGEDVQEEAELPPPNWWGEIEVRLCKIPNIV